jgi:signal transduction histidine kinase
VAIENARLVTALQEAYDDLGKLDKMKSDFIAIASHELRTPLGVILGYATFLREDTKGEMGQYAQAVFDSAVHMRKLVEDMTNLRFMEVGQMPVQREAVNLHELLAEARQDTLVLAEAKGQKILLLPCDPPLVTQADRAKLIVAVSNLINNAIRYTPDGGTVELSAYRKDDEAWLQVKDNGRGISQRNLESIFDGFYQVEDHMTRKSGGLGIGLSIVRNTMKLLGGRVWAESPGEGRGSTFICALPLT